MIQKKAVMHPVNEKETEKHSNEANRNETKEVVTSDVDAEMQSVPKTSRGEKEKPLMPVERGTKAQAYAKEIKESN